MEIHGTAAAHFPAGGSPQLLPSSCGCSGSTDAGCTPSESTQQTVHQQDSDNQCIVAALCQL